MIRELRRDDLEAVMGIWLEANIQAHDFISPQYWRDHYTAVREMLPRAEVYVWESEGAGRVEGFVGLTGSYIAGIFVRREVRSRGIGKQLLDHVKSIRPELTLAVYQKNTRAAGFYQREQFTVQSGGTDDDTGEREYSMVWSR